MDPVRVLPTQRLRVGDRLFRVISSRAWPSHTSSIVQEVADGSGS
jgi:hypothetical protein